ncbi:MAG: 6-carboxytetrahydropterin synthase [Lachnospiraceae bacterium]|nr:6-carboxytetrahydropterin synthase [Lachnospiraceae bacterium]MBP3506322.1 6-carboxytetrahydropterin synthase [Lachnospiraceae bacterium]
MQKYYKYQYRFNASHSFDYIKEHEHQHTFTITLYVSKVNQSEQIMFFDFDKVVNEYLKQYEYSVLNEVPVFAHLVPNIENMGNVFYDDLKFLLKKLDINLYQLDISENPLSTYQISSRIHLPTAYHDS